LRIGKNNPTNSIPIRKISLECSSNVLADDDTDGVFGGDWGSSSLRESETEREQYDKQRESVHFNSLMNVHSLLWIVSDLLFFV
jgi:hypothetical protein